MTIDRSIPLNAHLAATLLACAALAACGGGSGDETAAAADANAPTAAPASAVPAAPAAFKAGSNPAYILQGAGLTANGVLDGHTQRADGALTKVDEYQLGGEAAVREIQGDEDYALGRWVAGTVTDSRSTRAVTDAGGAYAYVAFNRLESLPTSGAPTCDSGAFTSSTRVDGTYSQAPASGTTSGSARLTFTESGAVINVTLQAGNGSSQGTVTANGTVARVTSFVFPGGIGGEGNTAVVTVGKSGTAYQVVGTYAVNLADRSRYTGVFRFRCA